MKREHWQFIDISPLVSEATAVFPGDTPLSREVLLDIHRGAHLHLTTLKATGHIGAHADAPIHYHANGQGIDQRSLHYYYGACQVVEVKCGPGARILPKDVKTPIRAPRVLFRTGSFPDPQNWRTDFNSLSPELVDELHQKGVVLVGIDTPSIDPADSKHLESHQALFRNDQSVLEGLDLSGVRDFDRNYVLSAFPLKLKGFDAGPVRAVLILE
ncbi:MAG: cyclase family protein [Bacteriovoracia bacterium]